MLVLHDHYGHWLRQKMKGPSSWQGKFVMNVDKRKKKEKKDRSWLQTVLDQEIRKVFTSRHNHTFHVTSRTTLPDSPPHTQLISHICFLGKLLTTRSICCRSQIPWSNFDFCQVIIQTNIRSKKLVNVKPALLTCPRWSVYLTNLSSSFTWRSTIPVMHRTTVIFWYCDINSHHMRILRSFCMQLPHVCLIWLKYSEWLNLNQSPAGQLTLRLGLWYLDNLKGYILMQPEAIFRPDLYPWLFYCDFQNTACTKRGWR